MSTCMKVLELLGLAVSILAWLSTLHTLYSPQWLSKSTEVFAGETQVKGLWANCITQEMGSTECRPFDSVLGLEGDIRMARSFLSGALLTGLLGVLVAMPGLYFIVSCREGKTKRVLKVSGGLLCALAGALVLVPVTLIAQQTAENFFDHSSPELVTKWDYGTGLFSGFGSGLLHLAGGVMLVSSSFCSSKDAPLARHHPYPDRAEVSHTSISKYV